MSIALSPVSRTGVSFRGCFSSPAMATWRVSPGFARAVRPGRPFTDISHGPSRGGRPVSARLSGFGEKPQDVLMDDQAAAFLEERPALALSRLVVLPQEGG